MFSEKSGPNQLSMKAGWQGLGHYFLNGPNLAFKFQRTLGH
jgi:hypothetical protein